MTDIGRWGNVLGMASAAVAVASALVAGMGVGRAWRRGFCDGLQAGVLLARRRLGGAAVPGWFQDLVDGKAVELAVVRRVIEVDGKAVELFVLEQVTGPAGAAPATEVDHA